jgi:hypothetical protein
MMSVLVVGPLISERTVDLTWRAFSLGHKKIYSLKALAVFTSQR